MSRLITSLVVVGALLGRVPIAHAYEVDAHKTMTSIALYYDQYGTRRAKSVVETLEFEGSERGAVERVRDGNGDEDGIFGNGSLPFMNHFHEPLTDSGLRYAGTLNDSSASWAQGYLAGTESRFGWEIARAALYRALTASTAEERGRAYDTRKDDDPGLFHTVGHVIHLIQDAASPAHVRNDGHPPGVDPSTYEQTIHEIEVLDAFGKSGAQLRLPLPALLEGGNAASRLGLAVPVSNLWDVEQYVGTCGNLLRGTVGLAEFTAAHFFSENTLTAPCPGVAALTAGLPGEPGEPGYFSLHVESSGVHVERALRMSTLGGGAGLPSLLTHDCELGECAIDSTVAKDYAAILVPQAIGYSAALWDYFFRGVVHEGKPTLHVERGGPGLVQIYNDGNETLGPGGTLEVYYDDLKSGQRERIGGAPVPVPLPPDGVWVLDDPWRYRGDTPPIPDAIQIERLAKIFLWTDTMKGSIVFVYRGPVGQEPNGIAARPCKCRDGEDMDEPPGAGCTSICSVPFQILHVSFPITVWNLCPAPSISVSWVANPPPKFPVTGYARFRSCPDGFACNDTVRTFPFNEFGSTSTLGALHWTNLLWCTTPSPVAYIPMDMEITLRDATGRESVSAVGSDGTGNWIGYPLQGLSCQSNISNPCQRSGS